MNERTKRICIIGMLCAVAFVAVYTVRIPIVLWLKYEPKDVIVTIGGLIYGPAAAFLISLSVSLIELVTISDTGLWGLVMNVLSTCTFACTASWIYRKERSRRGAVIGLVCGVLLMVPAMLLWNYLFTPIYMKTPREAVAALLIPYFLPFNLFKGCVNAGLTLVLYKPAVIGLRKASLIPDSSSGEKKQKPLALAVPALLVFAAAAVLLLLMRGVIG